MSTISKLPVIKAYYNLLVISGFKGELKNPFMLITSESTTYFKILVVYERRTLILQFSQIIKIRYAGEITVTQYLIDG